MLRDLLVGVASALFFVLPSVAQDRDILRKSHVGKTPPELVAADGDWLAGPRTSLATLKGKVVWLQFNF